MAKMSATDLIREMKKFLTAKESTITPEESTTSNKHVFSLFIFSDEDYERYSMMNTEDSKQEEESDDGFDRFSSVDLSALDVYQQQPEADHYQYKNRKNIIIFRPVSDGNQQTGQLPDPLPTITTMLQQAEAMNLNNKHLIFPIAILGIGHWVLVHIKTDDTDSLKNITIIDSRSWYNPLISSKSRFQFLTESLRKRYPNASISYQYSGAQPFYDGESCGRHVVTEIENIVKDRSKFIRIEPVQEEEIEDDEETAIQPRDFNRELPNILTESGLSIHHPKSEDNVVNNKRFNADDIAIYTVSTIIIALLITGGIIANAAPGAACLTLGILLAVIISISLAEEYGPQNTCCQQ